MSVRVALLVALLPALTLACNGSQAAQGESPGPDAGSAHDTGTPGVESPDSGSPLDATIASDAAGDAASDVGAGDDASDVGAPQDANDAGADSAPEAPTLTPDVRMIQGLTSDGYVVYARTASELDAISITGGGPQVITSSPLVHDVRIRGNVVLAGNVVWTATSGSHAFTAVGAGSNPSDFAVTGDQIALAYEDDAGVSRAIMATVDLSVQTPLGPSTCDITFEVVAGTLTTATCVQTEDGGVTGSIDAWDPSGNETHLLSSDDPFLSADGDDPSGTLYAASGSVVASIPISGGNPTVFFQGAFDNFEYGGVLEALLLPSHGALALSFYEGGYSFSPIAAPALTSVPHARNPTMPPTVVDCSGPIDQFSSDGNWFFSGGCMTSVTDGQNELPSAYGSLTSATAAGGTFTLDSKYAVSWGTLSDSDENWLAVYELQTGRSTLLAPYLLQLLWGGTRTAQVTADSRVVYIDVTEGESTLTIADPSQPTAKVAIASSATSFLLDSARTGVLYTDAVGLHYVALP